jgi:hypothetical protein
MSAACDEGGVVTSKRISLARSAKCLARNSSDHRRMGVLRVRQGNGELPRSTIRCLEYGEISFRWLRRWRIASHRISSSSANRENPKSNIDLPILYSTLMRSLMALESCQRSSLRKSGELDLHFTGEPASPSLSCGLLLWSLPGQCLPERISTRIKSRLSRNPGLPEWGKR